MSREEDTMRRLTNSSNLTFKENALYEIALSLATIADALDYISTFGIKTYDDE